MHFIVPGSWQGRSACRRTGTECVLGLQPAVRQPVHRCTWHTSGTVLHRDTQQELPGSHVFTETWTRLDGVRSQWQVCADYVNYLVWKIASWQLVKLHRR